MVTMIHSTPRNLWKLAAMAAMGLVMTLTTAAAFAPRTATAWGTVKPRAPSSRLYVLGNLGNMDDAISQARKDIEKQIEDIEAGKDVKINGKRPNYMLFMTDQQRQLLDFPDGWAEEHLPCLTRLQQNGITYTHNYINSAPCWANRGVLVSGVMPLVSQAMTGGSSLMPVLSNFAKVVKAAGYRMVYKGKWHLNSDFDAFSNVWTPSDATTVEEEDAQMGLWYGQEGWTSPDMGTGLVQSPNYDFVQTLGAGDGGNDKRIVTGEGFVSPTTQESVIDFIKNNADSEEPYFLVVSLVNPHDISVYPGDVSQVGYNLDVINTPAYDNFQLPETFGDPLTTKPDCQLNFLKGFGGGRMDEETALNYVKFYAHLTTLPDQLFGQIMDAMTQDQIDNTIIIRTSDHGEMGAAHGGMREKMNEFYEEAARIPLVISNPIIFPDPVVSNALVSQIDLLPTLVDMLGLNPAEAKKKVYLQGKSFAPTLGKPETVIQDQVLFTFFSGFDYDNVSPPGEANIICAIASPKWKYAVYFAPMRAPPPRGGNPYPDVPNTPYGPLLGTGVDGTGTIDIKISNWLPSVRLDTVQFEMYNLEEDPQEMVNLVHDVAGMSAATKEMWATLHAELTQELMMKNSLPVGWQNIVAAREIVEG